MTANQPRGLDEIARVAGEMTAAAVAGQAAGLNLLFSEMQALMGLMPGAATEVPPPAADEAARRAAEAEVEAGFDNMPV
jgi:hypothetical protein